MVGLGLWEVPVNSMFFKGTAKIKVGQINGEYDFHFEVPGFNVPEMDISNVTVKSNTLFADATCDMLKGKMLHVKVTFEQNTCSGVVSGPLGVKIKINGKKIPD